MSYYLRVAVKKPLRHCLDYLPPDNLCKGKVKLGMRVLVPLGKQNRVLAIITEIVDTTATSKEKLKYINQILDSSPLFSLSYLSFLVWASNYYHYPIGEAIFQALPVKLRKADGKLSESEQSKSWQALTDAESTQQAKQLLARAHKQRHIYNFLRQQGPKSTIQLSTQFLNWRTPLQQLTDKGLVHEVQTSIEAMEQQACRKNPNRPQLQLSEEQKQALSTIHTKSNQYNAFLLEGVTGSGKTEIYLRMAETTINNGKQVLILLPEIGLTTQIIVQFKDYFTNGMYIQHSDLSDYERLETWQAANTGKAQIIIGTRSAVWTPLPRAGLYIIDEEHDPSYKQQEKFPYSARDLALVRAHMDNVPIILGSATPSMESLKNANDGNFHHLRLYSRIASSHPVKYHFIDLKQEKMYGAISQTLVTHIQKELAKQHQVLLFLNRRGYANYLLCYQCGWKVDCPRCERPYTYHKNKSLLICHHCDKRHTPPVNCLQCDSTTIYPAGHGTERIEETLMECFSNVKIARIDRDTTKNKYALNQLLENIAQKKAQIIIGTQMITKGYHFPNITLAGVINADQSLFGNDYRATEKLAQLLIQVGGRSGRGSIAGRTLIQTHYPDHPLFQTLEELGYPGMSNILLKERQATTLPPYSYHGLLRAEATKRDPLNKFLDIAKTKALQIKTSKIDIFGPMTAPIEKRAGRYRMQLLLQTQTRSSLHRMLNNWLNDLEAARFSNQVKWSIDVDPQTML